MFADAHAALTSAALTDRVVSVAKIGFSLRSPGPECPRYFAALTHALAEELPPFSTDLYADTYRTMLGNKGWTARSLMTNAQREGEDARKLWAMAAHAEDPAERQLLKRHSVDQSAHASRFLVLLDLTFPGAAQPDFRAQLESLSPGYTMEQEPAAPADSPHARAADLDDFIQINLGQLRNASLQILMRPELTTHAPAENHPRLAEVMDSMLADELGHVVDTAAVIESRGSGTPLHDFADDFQDSLRRFIDLTSEEPIDRGYHLRFGNYP